MKRHAVALVIRPCKNRLIAEEHLRSTLDRFTEKLLTLCNSVTPLKINLVLPGYFFKFIDPLLLAQLRELHKTERLEWQSTGYTEPFASFSPSWLTDENLSAGMEFFNEFAAHPMGYAPPFSNWEPSMLCSLHRLGFQYAVLSRAILPQHLSRLCGYWITEYAGISFPVFPSVVLHPDSVPVSIERFLAEQLSKQPDPKEENEIKIATLEYTLSLNGDALDEQFQWLATVAADLERLIPKYRTVRLSDCQSLAGPLGLLSIPSGIRSARRDQDNNPFFCNELHTYDQVGILQRKMMFIAEQIQSVREVKERNDLLHQLFLAQDINRFLMQKEGGFRHITDRLWTYHKMINIERTLAKRHHSAGGHIKISNFLRNGSKSIIIGNQSLQAYIDYNGGAQIFELDFFGRAINLCAGFSSNRYVIPKILVAGKSPSSFIDYIFAPSEHDLKNITDKLKYQVGDFINGRFDHMVSKNANSVKVILNRRGIANIDEKPRPIRMEKVFSFEEDKPAMSFVYQLANPSLSSFGFVFATGITLGLPGVETNEAYLTIGGKDKNQLTNDHMCFDDISQWEISDPQLGVTLDFTVQKPVTLRIFPSQINEIDSQEQYGCQGTTFLICAPIELKENAVWSLIGKLKCKKSKMKGTWQNAV